MFRAGQLGNQLFQYSAISVAAPHQSILLVDMNELIMLFDCRYILNTHLIGRMLEKLLARIGYANVHALAEKTRLVRLASERYVNNAPTSFMQSGLTNCITLFTQGFYQCPRIVSRADVPRIKKPIVEAARLFLKQNTPENSQLYFVHHRRGDYLTWPSATTPAVLSDKWYQEQIRRIRSFANNPHFVVLSDDVNYVESIYGHRSDFTISHEQFGIDMAIMSLCSAGGILSPSSFSWWGAYFARENCNTSATFIAPEYWIGHTSETWYPPGIRTEWLTYA